MDRYKRPTRLLGLVCLLPLAAVGCRTMTPTKPSAVPSTPPTKESAAPPKPPTDNPGTIVKTEFHRKVTPDQQFNVHIELGRTQMKQGQFELALAEFKKALDATTKATGLRGATHKTEQQALAHRKVGDALDMLGKFGESEEHHKLATKLAPNDVKAWNDMGYSYYMQGRLADAERCLRRAATLDPNDRAVQTNLGLTLAMDGRTADALEIMSHTNGKAVAHANLGFALRSQGRIVEARDEYRKALELQPQLELAHVALAKLDAAPVNAKPVAVARVEPKPAAAPAATPIARPAPIAMPTPGPSQRGAAGADREVRTTVLDAPPPAPPRAPQPSPADIQVRPTSFQGGNRARPPVVPATTNKPVLPVPATTASNAWPRSTTPMLDLPPRPVSSNSVPRPMPLPQALRTMGRTRIAPVPRKVASVTAAGTVPLPGAATTPTRLPVSNAKVGPLALPGRNPTKPAPTTRELTQHPTTVPATDPTIRDLPSWAR